MQGTTVPSWGDAAHLEAVATPGACQQDKFSPGSEQSLLYPDTTNRDQQMQGHSTASAQGGLDLSFPLSCKTLPICSSITQVMDVAFSLGTNTSGTV